MKFSYPSGAKPLSGYTIKRGIGIGGFGEVYFALNDAGKEVALKKIQRNLDIELRGVTQCLNIRHVNLIALWDIQTSNSQESWVVMEYVPGPSLRDILDDYPRGLPESVLKLWFTSIASGVAYLHHRGIVHRDLKPANVFRDDDAHVIKIGDYGLSKFISSGRSSGAQTGTVGTVHYMAPEISKGIYGKEIDVYALGIILYELLTGDVPFDGETSQEIMYKHLLDEVNFEKCPSKYREVLRGSLIKEPESRFSNVSEMMAAMPWPEFRGKDAKILSLHSVGVFPRPESMSAAIGAGVASTEGARIEPILISNEDQASHLPEIVFGPLSDYAPTDIVPKREIDRLRGLRKTTPPRDSDVDEEAAEAFPKSKPQLKGKKLAKRTTVVGMEPIALMGPGEVETALDEMKSGVVPTIGVPKQKGKLLRLSQRKRIFAKKVARKCHGVSDGLTRHFLATPIRMGMLAFGAAVVVMWPQWLPWMLIVFAVAWGSWLLMRSWAGKSEIERQKRKTRKTGVHPAAIRQWLEQRPPADRFTQWLGSILVGTMSSIVLGLVGLLVWQSFTSANVEGWAFYTWLAVSCSAGCVLTLCCCSYWETQVEEDLLQRTLVMAGAGLITGLISVVAANIFEVDLTFANFTRPESANALGVPIPVVPAWLFFFVGLLGVLRWWRYADPLREARLKVWDVGVCVLWAAALSQLLGLPLLNSCVIASIISVSVQLASLWLSHPQRELVCMGKKNSRVA